MCIYFQEHFIVTIPSQNCKLMINKNDGSIETNMYCNFQTLKTNLKMLSLGSSFREITSWPSQLLFYTLSPIPNGVYSKRKEDTPQERIFSLQYTPTDKGNYFLTGLPPLQVYPFPLKSYKVYNFQILSLQSRPLLTGNQTILTIVGFLERGSIPLKCRNKKRKKNYTISVP